MSVPRERMLRWLDGGTLAAAALVVVALAWVWARRLYYPFDLEWMEGGMLAHAWRLRQGLPLYDPPSADFVPFVYPPGQPAVVAALSWVFGLTVVTGRAVSIASILAAAAALAFAVRRAGGRRVEAAAIAAVFLGTYPHAGAFYDIVRPDSLEIGLAGWAVALAFERSRRAVAASGLLLAAAFLVKQNAAVLGVPLLLGIGARDLRAGALFAAASLLPALVAIGALEISSHGNFLTWMIAVPATHAMLWPRAWIDTPREWGTALPVAFAVLGGQLVLRAVRAGSGRLPVWACAVVPVWTGMLVAWWWTYTPPPAAAPVVPVAYATAYWALGAGLVAAGILAVSSRWRMPEAGDRRLLELGVLLTAGASAALMRVHDGGYVNVHTPLYWSLSLAFGGALVRWRTAREAPLGQAVPTARALVAGALAAQLVWAVLVLHPTRWVPTEADLKAGARFVRELREVDGPVLSPFAAWLPVYAGKPPSLHAMGVWDCNYPGGPFRDDLAKIQRALREHRWTLIVGGQHQLLGDLTDHYDPIREIVRPDDPALLPKSGYMARPWRLLAPRE